MSWDLRIQCIHPASFESFRSQTTLALERLIGVHISSLDIILEASPNHPSLRPVPEFLGNLDDCFLIGLTKLDASFELVCFALNDGSRWFSIELPAGHSAAGFALASAAAIALSTIQHALIKDDAERWTNCFESSATDFLESIVTGKHSQKLVVASRAVMEAKKL
jgi:hypothetical protein